MDSEMDSKGMSLTSLASKGDEPGVKQLLNNTKFTPVRLNEALLCAATRGSAALCQVLLLAGADPNYVDSKKNQTCFPTSAGTPREAPPLTRQQTRLRRQLADIKSTHGTSLHKAVESRSIETVLLLLANGARVDKADSRGMTPIGLAARRPEYITVLEAMIGSGGSAVDVREPQTGRTTLHCAAAAGNLNAVTLLLHLGAALNARDLQGNSPLILAAKALRLHQSPHAGTTLGGDPPVFIFDAGFPHSTTSSSPDAIATVHYLVVKGANIRLVNRKGVTALMHAVEARETEIVKRLLTQGALVSSDLMQYACLVLQDAKVASCLLAGSKLIPVDATMAAILVAIVSRQSSKWTFANTQEEIKAHNIARLVLSHIRDVHSVDAMLDNDVQRKVLFSCISSEDRQEAEQAMVDYGILGYAMINGKYGVALMFSRSGFVLYNKSNRLRSKWLKYLHTNQQHMTGLQKRLQETLASPYSLKCLSRCTVRASLHKDIAIRDAITKLRMLTQSLMSYLILDDLARTPPFDCIIREDCEVLLNELYPDREQSRALHKSLFWVY